MTQTTDHRVVVCDRIAIKYGGKVYQAGAVLDVSADSYPALRSSGHVVDAPPRVPIDDGLAAEDFQLAQRRRMAGADAKFMESLPELTNAELVKALESLGGTPPKRPTKAKLIACIHDLVSGTEGKSPEIAR